MGAFFIYTSPVPMEVAWHKLSPYPKAPPCEDLLRQFRGGGGQAQRCRRGDCLCKTADLQIIQNDSRNNPSVTAKPCQPPLHKGGFFICTSRELYYSIPYFPASIVRRPPSQMISTVTGSVDCTVTRGSSSLLFLSSQSSVRVAFFPKGYFSTPWRSKRLICQEIVFFSALGLSPITCSSKTAIGTSPVQPTKSPDRKSVV